MNTRRGVFNSAHHVGCGMIWLPFLCSNQICEWKWQQASKGLLLAACLTDKGALQKQHAAFSGTMMPSLNNRNNDSTAGREMERERFGRGVEAGLRGGGVHIQQFGRKRMWQKHTKAFMFGFWWCSILFGNRILCGAVFNAIPSQYKSALFYLNKHGQDARRI